jgi:hypothetical protein
MAYTINKTSGAILTTIADGTIDTTSDLTLIGKNYAGYGELQNENYVKLLENFANTTQPGSPITGQLWFDSSNSQLKVYVSGAVGFKRLSALTSSTGTPSNNVTGDLWWDSDDKQLKAYDGSSFILVGPPATAGSGTSGAIVETVTDTPGGVDHVIISNYVNNTRVSVISKDSTFTPAVSMSGFSTIKPGVNLASTGTIAGIQFTGTASNADLLDSLDSTQFLRSDANDTTSGTLGVLNDTGFVVGADSDFKASVSGSDVILQNQTNDGDIYIKVNDGGSVTTALTVDGATSTLLVASDPTVALGVATKSYVDNLVLTGNALARDGSNTINGNILPDGNGTRNLGAALTKFATIYATTFSGTSTQAQYADVAERFHADDVYTPGTVVALGGANEITKVVEDASEDVFGVISDQPAHLMNAGAGTDETHPGVALQGRVPVQVVGKVNKGDRLISAGNGLARAGSRSEITPFNVIGRALTSKFDDGVGTVEAVVQLNS